MLFREYLHLSDLFVYYTLDSQVPLSSKKGREKMRTN